MSAAFAQGRRVELFQGLLMVQVFELEFSSLRWADKSGSRPRVRLLRLKYTHLCLYMFQIQQEEKLFQQESPFKPSISKHCDTAERHFVFRCTRPHPSRPPVMPTLPEEEEDSPEEMDSSSSSPITVSRHLQHPNTSSIWLQEKTPPLFLLKSAPEMSLFLLQHVALNHK